MTGRTWHRLGNLGAHPAQQCHQDTLCCHQEDLGPLGLVIEFDTEVEAVAVTNVGDILSTWLHLTGHANPM